MTTIVLTRHGETAWNVENRFTGQADVPLNDTGLVQAEALAGRLAQNWVLSAIYTSPLQRAAHTGQIVAQAMERRHGSLPEVISLPGLNDVDVGAWQGLLRTEVRQRWPEMAQAWDANSALVTLPGGESFADLRRRAWTAVSELIASHPEATIGIVAHTAVNRAILMEALEIDSRHYLHLAQGNCALNVLRAEAGACRLLVWNDTSHLP